MPTNNKINKGKGPNAFGGPKMSKIQNFIQDHLLKKQDPIVRDQMLAVQKHLAFKYLEENRAKVIKLLENAQFPNLDGKPKIQAGASVKQEFVEFGVNVEYPGADSIHFVFSVKAVGAPDYTIHLECDMIASHHKKYTDRIDTEKYKQTFEIFEGDFEPMAVAMSKYIQGMSKDIRKWIH
jgi:hypothetical protein